MNQRSCGIIDSLKNVLCIPDETPCPMNYIKVIGATDPIPNDMTYIVLKTTNSQVLFSNENVTGEILNQFRVEDGQPCMSPYYKSYIVPPYILDPYYSRNSCAKEINGQIIDERYELVDTNSNANLLSDNGIITITNTLPVYPQDILTHNVNLYKRNYIGVNPACLKTIVGTGETNTLMVELVGMNDKISSASAVALWDMVFGCILFFFMGIYSLIVIFVIYRDEGSDEEALKTKACLHIFPTVISLVCFILSAVLTSQVRNFSTNYSILANPTCVDGPTYEAISSFSSKIGSAQTHALVTTLASALMIGIAIANAIVSCVVN